MLANRMQACRLSRMKTVDCMDLAFCSSGMGYIVGAKVAEALDNWKYALRVSWGRPMYCRGCVDLKSSTFAFVIRGS